MRSRKLKNKFKKILLIVIIAVEILTIFYLIRSEHLLKFKPIFVDIPLNVIYKNNTNYTYNYFYTNEPNVYYIQPKDIFFGSIIYSTNSNGLRERYNYSFEKPKNVFRIAIFGDSFTYGLYSNISDVFTEILENRLNSLNCSKKIEVLNFGTPGYDIPYQIELFRQKGKYYNSDINIFTAKNDDIDIVNEIFFPINDRYLKQVGYPVAYLNNDSHTKYIDATTKAEREYTLILKNQNSTYLLYEQVEKPFNILYKENTEKSKIIFFTFVISPEYNEFLRNVSKEYGFTFLFLNDLGYSYIDLWDRKFSAIPKIDNHPNKLGHQFLADFLYVYLFSNNLIEC